MSETEGHKEDEEPMASNPEPPSPEAEEMEGGVELDEVDVRDLLRAALEPPPPKAKDEAHRLKGVQKRIRVLSTVKFYPDGWITSHYPRSTYSFRHTYATFRLSEGVDVYFLAQQMGTSVKMIEDHYGHVNAVKHADRVLHGMGSWEPIQSEEQASPETSKSGKAGTARSEPPRPRGNPKGKR